MQVRRAFTMLEAIFVIVIMGIIAKFGVEFFIKAYDSYIFSNVQNRLETQTGTALEEIANRLQYRIKPSVIVRDNTNPLGSWRSLADAQNNGVETILEWVGYDIDGFRGNGNPYWSGFIDLDDPAHTTTDLISPMTNTNDINTSINVLSNGTANVESSAIFFTGSNTDINGYGWGGAINDQNHTAHPIKSITTGPTTLIAKTGTTFSGEDVYEYYKLAWTAYALVYQQNAAAANVGYIASLDNAKLFDAVLENGITNTTGTMKNGNWKRNNATTYTVRVENQDVIFTYNSATGSFDCNVATQGDICRRLRN